uniref:Uncharacterized protein n=1 Tax=viral metagenome TaxID=1070528 RepID=A0A6M3JNR6_9ZZZZ
MRYYMTDRRFANTLSLAAACDGCLDDDEGITATEARNVIRGNRRMARDHARNNTYSECLGSTGISPACGVCGAPLADIPLELLAW